MKVCEITGKVAIVGNNVSHSHHKTKRKFSPNLKTKRFWSEQEGRWITLKVSAAGMKTINKKGLAVALREAAAPKRVLKSSNKWQRKATESRSSWSAPSRKRAALRECPVTSPPRNKKNTPDRLERKKYNPFLKRVTVHREIK